MKWFLLFLLISSATFGLRADINGDGRVDLLDLAILAEEWLMSKYGPELVVNGTFDVENIDAEWTYGGDWAWASDAKWAEISALFTSVSGSLEQTLDIEAGRLYEVVFIFSNLNNATVEVFLGGMSFFNFPIDYGTHGPLIIEAGDTDKKITFSASFDGNKIVSVDNISVREVLSGFNVKKTNTVPHMSYYKPQRIFGR